VPDYTTQPLTSETWADFATLVEANNGVWGGCWCMGFHPEGLKNTTAAQNRAAKQEHVRNRTVRQVLVYDGDACVGWCQFGTPAMLPNIKNAKAYDKELTDLPTGGSAASSPARPTGVRASPEQPSPAHSRRSRRQAVV
jgi:hypothetical protein